MQLEEHQDAIIAGVRTALVDESTSVRAAAAQSFDVLLQSEFGTKAIDQTIPTLLEALRQPGAQSETALRALREIMSVRANSIFPVVLPALIGGKLSAFNARALGSLVSVAGSALSRRLTSILQALVVSIESDNEDEEVITEVNQTMRILLSSIEDIEGLNSLMMTLLGWAKGDAPRRRVSALSCLCVQRSPFCLLRFRADSTLVLLPTAKSSARSPKRTFPSTESTGSVSSSRPTQTPTTESSRLPGSRSRPWSRLCPRTNSRTSSSLCDPPSSRQLPLEMTSLVSLARRVFSRSFPSCLQEFSEGASLCATALCLESNIG